MSIIILKKILFYNIRYFINIYLNIYIIIILFNIFIVLFFIYKLFKIYFNNNISY